MVAIQAHNLKVDGSNPSPASICRYDGIGRRMGLKIPGGYSCGFKSHYLHQCRINLHILKNHIIIQGNSQKGKKKFYQLL